MIPLDCDPRRHGRFGVMLCPHGCVTECAAERLEERTPVLASGPPPAAVLEAQEPCDDA